MPGGAPQGTVLGVITFIIQMIGARAFPFIDLSNVITSPGVKQVNTACKFIDDLTTASAIKLKTSLYQEENLERPRMYHSRTGHCLHENQNLVRDQINFIIDFSERNQMKINKDKTNLMLFNRCRKYDFQPIVMIDEKQVDVVEETKILGVIISSNLKWERNVAHITKKFHSKLWTLRRMKQLGATIEELILVYKIQLRGHTDYACPVWNGSLTQKDVMKLEKLQRIALKLILGNHFTSYRQVLKTFNLDTLENRRRKLCLKFATKTSKSSKFAPWFQKSSPLTRNVKQFKKFREPYARTAAYEKSPLPYLIHLLNSQ